MSEGGSTGRNAAKRLHHLGLVYSGFLAELAKGEHIVGLPVGHPGLSGTRDLISLVLLTRAEINGITRILLEKGIVTREEMTFIMQDEYEWLAEKKAEDVSRFFGFNVKVTDDGLNLGTKP